MKTQRIGTILVILGVVLIISALLLLNHNNYIEKKAYKESMTALNILQHETQKNQSLAYKKDTISINKNIYIGYIEIPKIDIQLPVLSDWDYDKLKTAPCRHFGDVKSNDLVIAAHNYKKHFGRINNLQIGDDVSFVDVNNCRYSYVIKEKHAINPTDVDKVQNSGYDLVLYTCTYGGRKRIALFCNKILDSTDEYYN